MDQGWDQIEIDALVRPVIEGGDYVHQVLFSDRLLHLVSELEAETHDEDDAMTRRDAARKLGKYALTSREWQTLDWFFDGVLARRGVFELNGAAFIRVIKALGKEVIEEMQSVIDSRTAWAEMDADELEAAAAEKDSRKAFWMYLSGPMLATKEKDFIERVLPAVRDLPLDDYGRAQWAEEFGNIPGVPEDATYTHALAMAGLLDGMLVQS
jgi:hypothetical protein